MYVPLVRSPVVSAYRRPQGVPGVPAVRVESGAEAVKDAELIAEAGKAIANAITPRSAAGHHDDYGGYVESLTEAVISVSAALGRIASAIQAVADAIEAKP